MGNKKYYYGFFIPAGLIVIIIFYRACLLFGRMGQFKKVMENPDSLMTQAETPLPPEQQEKMDKLMANVRGEINVRMSEILFANRIDTVKRAHKAKDELKLNPKNYSAHLTLGLCYQNLKMLPKAEEEIKLSIKYKSDYAASHYALGNLYAKEMKYAEAKKEIETSLKFNSNNPLAKKQLAFIKKAMLRRTGTGHSSNYSNKSNEQIQSISKQKKKPNTEQNTSFTKSKSDNQKQKTFQYSQQVTIAEARKYLERIQKDPNDVEAHLSLGLFYQNAKNSEKYVKEFKKVIELDSNNIVASYHLGHFYYNERNYNEAFPLLKKVVQADPNNKYANSLLKAVKKKLNY